MISSVALCTTMSFSAGDLLERDRLSYFHDFFARHVIQAEFQPLSDEPFQFDATLHSWPGLRATQFKFSAPGCLKRTPAMVADGDDTIAILVKKNGRLGFSHRGNEVSLETDDAVGVLHSEPAEMAISQVDLCTLIVPFKALAPLVRNVEDAAGRLIVQDTEALRLLGKYSGFVCENLVSASPELQHLAVTHIYDLMAMVIGPTRDGAAMASERGVRTARLRAIKTDMLENLACHDLTVTAVALRQRITPRYIHMLFETECVTFMEFVIEQRLLRANHMLCDPRFAGLSISAIAYDAGFGDLSYFNRSYRRRFGETPSDTRHRFHEGNVSNEL
jgi:AraC-like DNA-binding protein